MKNRDSHKLIRESHKLVINFFDEGMYGPIQLRGLQTTLNFGWLIGNNWGELHSPGDFDGVFESILPSHSQPPDL